jgi:hypothetical protein
MYGIMWVLTNNGGVLYMKTCKTCSETKSLDCFSPSVTRQGKPTTHGHCKACRTEKGKRSRDDRLTTACACCGKLWRKTGGESRKNVNVCTECYPTYRTAFTLHSLARNRAKKKGLEFDLDVEWVYEKLKPLVCERTGIDLTLTNKGAHYGSRNPLTPSLDKINPKGGYTKDNVQVVSWWYNLAKFVYTDQQVLEICRAIVNQTSSDT